MKNSKKPNLGFIYLIANDLKAIRHFYTDIVGLHENSYFEDEKFGWLSYHMGELEMDWFRSDQIQPITTQWAMQPGYPGGTKEMISWSIDIEEELFPSVIQKVKEEKYPLFQEEPEYRQECYWGFSVMDPMGNTVELYYVPKKKV